MSLCDLKFKALFVKHSCRSIYRMREKQVDESEFMSFFSYGFQVRQIDLKKYNVREMTGKRSFEFLL